MGSLRLLVADDHQIVRAGVRSLLEAEPGWQVVAEAADGREAVAKTAELRPDVVLLDIGMPVLNGLEAAWQIVESGSRAKILMLTVHDSDAMIRKVLAVGIRGYVFKTDAATDLVNAVKDVQNGNTFFTSRVAAVVLDGFIHYRARPPEGSVLPGRLTLRQREVTQLLAEGHSTKEVATLLQVSVKTAETHRANVMRRLDCHSVAELVRYALRNQIIEA
ncbi:MAG TPA: response regulator transcription factor [Candidatus Acidoferrum sp.]|nr:response regulator transcription factor [Candidatus Acidoferrum sp.]